MAKSNSIISLKVAQLAMFVAQQKSITLREALGYVYASPFYTELYNEDAKWWYLDVNTLYHHLETANRKMLAPTKAELAFWNFCVERYADMHNQSALQIYALFEKYKVSDYLIHGFEVLHTQGEEYIMHDIEVYLYHHKND